MKYVVLACIVIIIGCIVFRVNSIINKQWKIGYEFVDGPGEIEFVGKNYESFHGSRVDVLVKSPEAEKKFTINIRRSEIDKKFAHQLYVKCR